MRETRWERLIRRVVGHEAASVVRRRLAEAHRIEFEARKEALLLKIEDDRVRLRQEFLA